MRAPRNSGKTLALLAAVAGLIVYAAVAIADNTVADGDGVTPIGDNNLAFGDVACGVTSQKTVLVALKRNGSYSPGTEVFKKSTQATVSVFSATGTGVSGSVPASPDNLIDVPSNWDTVANNTMTTDYVEGTVSVNSSVEGAGSGSVTFRASGTNPSNNPVSRDDVVNVTWNTGSCAPANTAPTVSFTSPPSTANEGDTKTFNFTVSDPDSGDTFSVAGDPDCGTGGSYVAASLTTTASGGSFQCLFADGPANPTVSIQVKDGSDAASNVATTGVSVANVAPTVEITGGADSVNEGATETYTYTVSDPGDDPNPTVTEDCGDDGTLTDTAAANSFDCTFPDGPNNSTVSVSADDGDASNNTGSDSIDVTIANVAPTVELSGAASANEGATETYTYTVSDPGDDPNPTVTEDCGDDGTLTDTAAANSFDCTFPDGPNNSTVSVSADDGDASNNIGSDSIDVTIANLAPDVGDLTLGGASGPACVGGNSVTLDFGFTDAGVNDADWAVNIDWGDGSTDTDYDASTQGAQGQQSHTYGAGSHQIVVTVTDKDGDSGTSDSAQGSSSFLYNMTGILAPFNADGSSVWKHGSTIPVKVKVTDCNGSPVSGLKPQVGTSMLSTLTPADGISETVSTSGADTTGVMRYDSLAGQYIYNFASKALADGNATYYMYVRGKDAAGNLVTNASQVSQRFGLRTK